MTIPRRSWRPDTFDRIYAASPDPWGFTSSPYEREKYRASLATLRGRRFAHTLEIGCSIGVFTRALARQSRTVLGVDVAAPALAAARRRCRGLPGVRIARRHIPAQWPCGTFDLIVFSEVLYFLSPADIARTASRAVQTLRPGGLVLLVNWTGPTDTPCSGDLAANLFRAASRPALRPVLSERHKGYRLDLLAARGAIGTEPALTSCARKLATSRATRALHCQFPNPPSSPTRKEPP